MESLESKILRTLQDARRVGHNAVVEAIEKADLPQEFRGVIARQVFESLEKDVRALHIVLDYNRKDNPSEPVAAYPLNTASPSRY